MRRLDGKPLSTGAPGDREGLARSLLGCPLDQVLIGGVCHADPHPGTVLLLDDGTLGLIDFGSVGRLDAGLRAGRQNPLLALDCGGPAGLRDSLLEVVDRTEEIDERLERALGALLARQFGPGRAPVLPVRRLSRVVADFRPSVPPPIAAVFRSLATADGTLAALTPGFDVVAETRAFAAARTGAQLHPGTLRPAVTDDVPALLRVLRRLRRRVDRIGPALEQGRLSVNVRLFSDQRERDRDLVTGLAHEVLPAFAGIATGLMAVLLLGSSGSPRLLPDLTLNQVFGYNLFVISALLGPRLLFVVFRRTARRSRSRR
ncbi:AarF/UbiB family protein [Amycolatopsis sp. FDAARGOS 1241]|uniref:AarF/UbiB family protein n=1 Tax=Amycolatopsis sp. FDAARGOS 1241 TaxID=2778070 RepID=UPI00351C6D8D